ncbi:MAG: FAD-binding oxidoreductase [Acetobacteraceae bacterium]|nr:FAD-binding oxidoreductase [Acetobacteraceae bacterium]
MDTFAFDVAVIGAGIAGSTVAAALAPHRRVVVLEAEEAAGYHTTGRSAAIWILNYGPPDVRVLTGLSRPFFETPPEGFADVPLMARRSVVFLAPPEQQTDLATLLAGGHGLREIDVAQVRAMVPALRPDYAVGAAIEDDAFDMDVATLHQGYLRVLRRHDGRLALRHRAGRIERRDGQWDIQGSTGDIFRAPVVVNAAGAWGDEVATIAGVKTLGLVPCRRTGVIINPEPWQVADWPLLNDVTQTWYTRPEARTRLMVTPADATPMHPHDVQPDELDVAIAIDRMQQALDIEVRRVERSWAGLRTFTPDHSLAFGPAPDAPGFFWCVGQGGYGIQTSPAAGRFMADLILGRDPGAAASIIPQVDPGRFTQVG